MTSLNDIKRHWDTAPAHCDVLEKAVWALKHATNDSIFIFTNDSESNWSLMLPTGKYSPPKPTYLLNPHTLHQELSALTNQH